MLNISLYVFEFNKCEKKKKNKNLVFDKLNEFQLKLDLFE